MNTAAKQHRFSTYHTHLVPPSVLVSVFLLLILLTIATVAATWIDLGQYNIWIAMIIAVAKAALVALYFMHLRYDSPFNALILVIALLFTTMFIAITLKDTVINTRNLQPPPSAASNTG